MVLHVVENLDDYYKQIMNQKWTNKLIICYFTASWCGPCKMISPDITTLGEKTDNLLVLKIDVDDCEEVASQCDIDCMPTFRFHIGNSLDPVKKLMGVDKNSLFNIIGEILNHINSNQSQAPQTDNGSNNHQNPNGEVKRNTEMDVPFLYNPIPEHKFS